MTPEEFEQKYRPGGDTPIQVWVYCRLCRCRIQVRTIPRPELPFRCFCGYSGTLKKFDVWTDEEEARRFAATFEEIYQATKTLMREAEMPLQTTGRYSPDEMLALKEGRDPENDSAEEDAPPARLPAEDTESVRRITQSLTDAVLKARDVIERHDALSKLGVYAFLRRGAFPEARRVAMQSCEKDVEIAQEVVKEATVRFKRGERVKLRFPLFKRLILLLVEDQKLERALEVAVRGAQLGLPGYEARIEMLQAKLGKQVR